MSEIKERFYIFQYDIKVKIGFKKNTNTNKTSERKIHLLYFSCKKHYPYLRASLKSLKRLCLNCMGTVYLYCDKKDFFSNSQQRELKDTISNIIIKKSYYEISGIGGPKMFISQLTALRSISPNIGKNDYIAKVDSDTIFISNSIFLYVMKSDSSLIGQPVHEVHPISKIHTFTQGGCYFLKNSIVPQITEHPIYKTFLKAKKKLWYACPTSRMPDEVLIYNLVKELNHTIDFINFYLPIKKIDQLTEKDKEVYSVIHFERCEDKMLAVFEKYDSIKNRE